MAGAQAPSPRYRYRDYVLWAGDERWELHEGRAVAMSPAPGRLHQQVVTEMIAQVVEWHRGRSCRGFVAPFDVRLPVGNEADADVETVVQPDLVVVCDPAKLDDAGCRGAPDWVVEVLSVATSSRDRITKRELYERHGVREYWIVDPVARSVAILSQHEGRFDERVVDATGTVEVGALDGLAIDFDRVFAG